MRILVDMNLGPLWIPFLQHGFEAIHWSSAGTASASDAQSWACRKKGCVIFTHDLDFGMLLAIRSSAGPSVVQIRIQNVLPPAVGTLVVNSRKSARLHLETGALVTIDACSTGSGFCRSIDNRSLRPDGTEVSSEPVSSYSRSRTRIPRSGSAANSVNRMASRLSTNSASRVGWVHRRSHTTFGGGPRVVASS